ncbi:MAG: alpha/beta fold hydrolase [Anaerolineae bacterium]
MKAIALTVLFAATLLLSGCSLFGGSSQQAASPTAAPTQAAAAQSPAVPKAAATATAAAGKSAPTAAAAASAKATEAPKASAPTVAPAASGGTPAPQAIATNTPRLRPLDFSPFQEALAGFTPQRAAKVEAVVKDGDIAKVQAAMKAGTLTSEELTLYFLSRIKQYDDTLRTYVELNPDALKEARAADALRKQGKNVGPMLGIPVSLKDNIETKAPMHTTGGAEILLNNVPKADAPLVKQLHDAGAVILGKNNLSELAGGIALLPPGASAIGGQTGNPHGDFSPGGSSSGSGASTAAYLAMASVGSETAGSLILPASWNGVVGMYPSKGVVSGAGVIPLIKNNDSAGPIARNVRDVATLLGIIDTKNVDYTTGLDPKALNGVKAGFLQADILAQPASPLEDTKDNAAIAQLIQKSLTGAGATVTDITLKPDGAVDQLGRALGSMIAGGVRHDMLPYLTAAGAPVKSIEDLAAYNQKDPTTRIPWGQAMVDASVGADVLKDPKAYQELIAQARDLATKTLETAFAENKADVLVSVGNYHSGLYATANYPAITVPLGKRTNGMPVGVTLIGKPGQEAKLLAYAYALEQATKLRVNPDLSKVTTGAAPAASTASAKFSKAWQSVSCDTFDIAKDIAAIADCGYVTVPENRAKGGARTIQLAVVRVKSPNQAPGAPVFLGTGGPGADGLTQAQAAVASLEWPKTHADVLADRDWVFFSQRGTKHAKPELTCPEYDLIELQTAVEGWNEQQVAAQITKTLQACRDKYAAQGVDFSGYNSNENAADVNDIRQALGYDKIIYYGQSYGTQLGQFLMRNHPDSLQAVILDGVEPVKFTAYSQAVNLQDSFLRVFAACKADADCNANYPDLDKVLTAVYDQLEANPQPVEVTLGNQKVPLKLTGTMILNELLGGIYGGGADVPHMIYALKDNDPVTLKALAPKPPKTVGTVQYLMQYAFNCADDPITSVDEADTKSWQKMYAAMAREDNLKTALACKLLQVPHLPASSDVPVVSKVPVLILNGGLDPVTPVSNGDTVAATLANSQSVVFPAGGHVQEHNPCALGIMKAFMNNPSAKVDTTCVAPKPVFNTPFEAKVTADNGSPLLTLTMPAGMKAAGPPNTWQSGNGMQAISAKAYPAGTSPDDALNDAIQNQPLKVENPQIVDGEPIDGRPTRAIHATATSQGMSITVDTYAVPTDAGTVVLQWVNVDSATAEDYRQTTLPATLKTIKVSTK